MGRPLTKYIKLAFEMLLIKLFRVGDLRFFALPIRCLENNEWLENEGLP